MSNILTAERVHSVFMDCLFKEGEPQDNPVMAMGIMSEFGFQPDRLEGHKETIAEMMDELPSEFKEGWSFLNACNDKHGNQWTGEHRSMEQLVSLGIATGKASWLMPREMWPMMPGGMPYFVVKTGDE